MRYGGSLDGIEKVVSICQEIYEHEQRVGREDGREEGIKIGREIGREECRTDITLNMLQLNQPVEFIAEVVELPVEKIIEIGKAHALI